MPEKPTLSLPRGFPSTEFLLCEKAGVSEHQLPGSELSVEGAVDRWLPLTPFLHHCPRAETTGDERARLCFSSQQLTQTFVIAPNLGGNVLLVPKCTEAGMPFHSLESTEQRSLSSPHCMQSERLGRKTVGSAAVRSVPWEEVQSSFHAFSHLKPKYHP